jgi:hypothetical protein
MLSSCNSGPRLVRLPSTSALGQHNKLTHKNSTIQQQQLTASHNQPSLQQLNLTTARAETPLLHYRVFQMLGIRTTDRRMTSNVTSASIFNRSASSTLTFYFAHLSLPLQLRTELPPSSPTPKLRHSLVVWPPDISDPGHYTPFELYHTYRVFGNFSGLLPVQR